MSLSRNDFIPEINIRNIVLASKRDRMEVEFEVFVELEDLKQAAEWMSNTFYKNVVDLNVSAHTTEQTFLDDVIDRKPKKRNISEFAFKREEDTDGTLSWTVSYPNLNPTFLGYTFFVTLNGSYLNESFGIDPKTKFLQKRFVVARERIIEEGDIVSNGVIFRDESEEIWTGPVEVRTSQGQNQFFKDGTEDRLDRIEVDNTKVQDLRSLTANDGEASTKDSLKIRNERVEEFKSDFERKFKQKVQRKFSPKRDQEYFSRLCLTKRSDLIPSGLFGINWHEIVRDTSEFSGLAQGNGERFKAIKQLSNIDFITIERRRVQPDREMSRLEVEVDSFDEVPEKIRDVEEIIKASPGELPFSLDVQKGDIQEKVLVMNQGEEMRFFDFEDKTADRLTYGHYAYKAKFTIEDGTRPFLREIVSRLRDLEQYIASYQDDVNEFAKSNPNDLSFAGAFNSKIKRKFSNREDPSEVIANEFSTILNLLLDTDKVGPFTDRFMILSMVNPRTGSPKSVRYIKEYVKTIISVLQDRLKQKIPTNSSISNSEVKAVVKSSSDMIKKTQLTHTFAQLMDADSKPAVKFFDHWDFPNQSPVQVKPNVDTGLTKISPDTLVSRKRSEERRFYSDPEADISLTKEESLTPSSSSLLQFAPTKLGIGQNEVNASQLQQTSVSDMKVVENTLPTPSLQFGISDPQKDLSATLLNPFVRQVENETLEDTYSFDFNNGFLTDVEVGCFENPEMKIATGTLGSIQEQAKIDPTLKARAGQNVATSSYDRNSKNVFSVAQQGKVPMQVRSLTLASEGETGSISNEPFQESFRKGNLSSADIPLMRNTYSMIHTVEKLDGFKKDEEGRELVKSAKWSELSEGQLTASQGPTLCRLKKTQHNPLKFFSDEFYSNSDLSDRYFVVEERQRPTPEEEDFSLPTGSLGLQNETQIPKQKIRTDLI